MHQNDHSEIRPNLKITSIKYISVLKNELNSLFLRNCSIRSNKARVKSIYQRYRDRNESGDKALENDLQI